MALDVFIVDMQHLENSVGNTFNMVWPNGKSMLQTVDLHKASITLNIYSVTKPLASFANA